MAGETLEASSKLAQQAERLKVEVGLFVNRVQTT
jgi:hypothetical protein